MTKITHQKRVRRGLVGGHDLPFDLFTPGFVEPLTDELVDRTMAEFPGATREIIVAQLEDVRMDAIFINSRYQVNIRDVDPETMPPGWPALVHLSIKRRDKERVGPERYRDFMAIKDRLIGAENEAVELYPARSREYDTANQFHIWVMKDPAQRWPFGYDFGERVVSAQVDVGGARQEPFTEAHHVYRDGL